MQIKLHDILHIKNFPRITDFLTFPYCLLSWRCHEAKNPKNNISSEKINANKAQKS